MKINWKIEMKSAAAIQWWNDKKDEDEEIASNNEERDCNPTQVLIAKFLPNKLKS